MMPRKVRRMMTLSEVSETSSETARDGTKNFDQIYTYIQEVAKSKSEHSHVCVYSNHPPRRGYEPGYPPWDSQSHWGDASWDHGIDIRLISVSIYFKYTDEARSRSISPTKYITKRLNEASKMIRIYHPFPKFCIEDHKSESACPRASLAHCLSNDISFWPLIHTLACNLTQSIPLFLRSPSSSTTKANLYRGNALFSLLVFTPLTTMTQVILLHVRVGSVELSKMA